MITRRISLLNTLINVQRNFHQTIITTNHRRSPSLSLSLLITSNQNIKNYNVFGFCNTGDKNTAGYSPNNNNIAEEALKNVAGKINPNISKEIESSTNETLNQLNELEKQYKGQDDGARDAKIFLSILEQSKSPVDQMNLFKVFKILQDSPFSLSSYEFLFEWINTNLQKKSDNVRLLLATLKERIAKYQVEELSEPKTAVATIEQALDILEYSMIPPLFPYYNIYREQGLIYYEMNERQKALEVLTETVNILDDFVSHSDDNVSTNKYSKKQAMSYNRLIELDPEPQNKQKYLAKANKHWDAFTGDKFKELEYAKTVGLNLIKELTEDEEKGMAYYNFNLYKFEQKEMKDILKKVKVDFEKRHD